MNDRDMSERFLSDATPEWMKGEAAVFDLDFDLAAKAGALNLDIGAKAKEALAGLQAKLETAAAEAFDQGKAFAVGPVIADTPDPFAIRDITRPLAMAVTVTAGPVDKGFEAPPGWVVYQRPEDWKARR